MIAQYNPEVDGAEIYEFYDQINDGDYVTFEYDHLDRKLYEIYPDGTATIFEYFIGQNSLGVKNLCLAVIDANEIITEIYSSPRGWKTETKAPDNSLTTFEYNALGELLKSTNPDGYSTEYLYNIFGQLESRHHPDAGETYYEYDLMGNVVTKAAQRELDMGVSTQYLYDYGRLTDINYPLMPERDVHYEYGTSGNETGRIISMKDAVGEEFYTYNQLGALASQERHLYLPLEQSAFAFKTEFKYDIWNRLLNMTYSDGEVVYYNYNEGGQLTSMCGNEMYIQNIIYDKFGSRTYSLKGDAMQEEFVYDNMRRLSEKNLLSNGVLLQDIHYTYDDVGNIISQENYAPVVAWGMGGGYEHNYLYDSQYRLEYAFGNNVDDQYNVYTYFSPAGRIYGKVCDYTGQFDVNYYDTSDYQPHAVKLIESSRYGDISVLWDRNGNMQGMVSDAGLISYHLYDEDNNMISAINNSSVAYYGYNASQERMFKLTGPNMYENYNAGDISTTSFFDDFVLYPNPYLVVTPSGYSKHYYAGSERIASSIGGDGLPEETIITSDETKQGLADDLFASVFTEQLELINYD
ncbi:MAG: RHS repeat domain-containing protein, partial [bacterium]